MKETWEIGQSVTSVGQISIAKSVLKRMKRAHKYLSGDSKVKNEELTRQIEESLSVATICEQDKVENLL